MYTLLYINSIIYLESEVINSQNENSFRNRKFFKLSFCVSKDTNSEL